MRIIARIAIIALLAPLPAVFDCARADSPRQQESAAAWRPIFDGRSLDGWEHVGPGRFVLEDGVLRTEGGMGLLWYSREKLGNCVIRVVYRKATERANSGVYIRIADRPKDPWYAVHHGFEVQIMDSGPAERRTGSIYTFSKAAGQPGKAGEWDTLEIALEGNRVVTRLNGAQVSEFDSSELKPQSSEISGEGDPARGPRPESGYIGLQNHDKGSVIYFKEVSVRPLPSPAK
jgi:hypothetical protein